MANSSPNKQKPESSTPAPPLTPLTIAVPLVAWLVPGAGHLIQKKWVRGGLILLSVSAMFLLGLSMQGRIYQLNGGDILDMLGFVGDLGAGGLYLGVRLLDAGNSAISNATADYGKVFMIVAGLLNFMCVADAYHIAIGKKP
ncbi:MAG: hypothetical protein JST79_03885 [Acidobacteria bacterium]|jgi:hypothetical protein|nr:hypothetical protein [Acidobacteriota bacterium]